jgi:hypothetical protein
MGPGGRYTSFTKAANWPSEVVEMQVNEAHWTRNDRARAYRHRVRQRREAKKDAIAQAVLIGAVTLLALVVILAIGL